MDENRQDKLFICPLCHKETVTNTGKRYIFEGIEVYTFCCSQCRFQLIGKPAFLIERCQAQISQTGF